MVELLPGATGILRPRRNMGSELSAHAFDSHIGFVTGMDHSFGVATVAIDGEHSVCTRVVYYQLSFINLFIAYF
jgi:hypothetical protein